MSVNQMLLITAVFAGIALGLALARAGERIRRRLRARRGGGDALADGDDGNAKIRPQRWAAEMLFGDVPLQDVEALRTRFLAEVANELRAPATSIVLAARIILKHYEQRPEVVEQFGPKIVNEGDRLAHLINDFLELARIESEGVEWAADKATPADLLSAAIVSHEATAKEAGVTIQSDLVAELPVLYVDTVRVNQVLGTLIEHTLKYAKRGATIALDAAYDSGDFVFAVGDNSPGLRGADGHNGSAKADGDSESNGSDQTPQPGGNGLGLCIATAIVQHYGGHIWTEGISSSASAFVFTIPETAVRLPQVASPSTATADRTLDPSDNLAFASGSVRRPDQPVAAEPGHGDAPVADRRVAAPRA